MKITKNDLKKIIKEVLRQPSRGDPDFVEPVEDVETNLKMARTTIDELCDSGSFIEETLIRAIAERCLNKGKFQSPYWTKLGKILKSASSAAQKGNH